MAPTRSSRLFARRCTLLSSPSHLQWTEPPEKRRGRIPEKASAPDSARTADSPSRWGCPQSVYPRFGVPSDGGPTPKSFVLQVHP
jgi:hypothetical protein